jgi:murein DD-endopeptidase MepM/ murein hydrolase activator NlpD
LNLLASHKVMIFGVGLAVLAGMFYPMGRAVAQKEQPAGPVYVVQEGDTLWDIARRFGVSVDDLSSYNSITDPNQIAPGVEMVIPGLEGVSGVLVTRQVAYGENLRSLSRRFHIPENDLARLNRLTSPRELYTGASLIIPEASEAPVSFERATLSNGQSLLELAVIQGANPWTLTVSNYLSGTGDVLPGDVLLLADDDGDQGPGAFSDQIQSVEVNPLPVVQGRAAVVRLQAQSELSLSGSLTGHDLNFFRDQDGSYVAIQGVNAMTDPGFYPLELQVALPDGTSIDFSQLVFVQSGDYAYERLTVSEETLDPKNTQPEDELWNSLTIAANPERYWDGVFVSPVSPLFAECWPSYFGTRRSYNGSTFSYYHTGLDFCGGVGAEIYAVAPGVVVFTGDLTVRGNATMIDHGWGVYTGYMHQSEILVEEGQRVEAGQVIGLIGGTGRVTGAHLHLEVWAGGVQVDPMEWLEISFP